MNDVERPIYADLIALLPQAHSDEPLGHKLDRREIDELARFCSEVRDAERAAHDAYRQEVSDAVEATKRVYGGHRETFDQLDRFIIQPKTDPLVEVIAELSPWNTSNRWNNDDFSDRLRKALAKRGLEIWEAGE